MSFKIFIITLLVSMSFTFVNSTPVLAEEEYYDVVPMRYECILGVSSGEFNIDVENSGSLMAWLKPENKTNEMSQYYYEGKTLVFESTTSNIKVRFTERNVDEDGDGTMSGIAYNFEQIEQSITCTTFDY